LKLLRELRSRLVDAVDEVTCVRDLEPLARRLDVVSAEIAELAPLEQESPLDQILARREQRRSEGKPVPPGRAAARGGRVHG
jgi:hypothetical protein